MQGALFKTKPLSVVYYLENNSFPTIDRKRLDKLTKDALGKGGCHPLDPVQVVEDRSTLVKTTPPHA